MIKKFAVLMLPLSLAALLPFALSAVQQDPAVLLKTADEVLNEVSRLRQLSVKSPIQKGIKNREEIRAYMTERIREEYTPEELEIEGRVLKKLRLIPEDMNMYEFALNLLTEQVAGFYDPKTKTFYIADWLSPEAQKPIMAHELTHALQDQHYDVGPFLKRQKGNDDAMMARNAVLEGDAVAVMIDYMMQPMGRTFLDLPDLRQFMGVANAMAAEEFKIFASAPAYFRETLMFPYTAGVTFLQNYRKSHGWPEVRRIFESLPLSTEQIIHPEKYGQERDDPVAVTPKGEEGLPGNGWKSLYSNVLGEFTTQLVLREFLEEAKAEKAAAGWDGDLLQLMQDGAGREVLVMRFVFDSEADATEFRDLYGELLSKKYPEDATGEHSAGKPSIRQDGIEVTVIE